ncbi:3-hydroxyisobutyrate dehydrogenase [Motilibacter peucedani]|uniref:3-hydroxyisobutyrate dehydrogenase n=1 Tax=Motilibacter peucedani TaxID=598650 RepID=A0A420XMN7_9ACTN|nr:NAD(P)-dependent oxidoreductase [Motilibacter peucedani]RKS72544.1 3-hydroxyisobutyrate dehydrogenase [Motilibacter peucedani]
MDIAFVGLGRMGRIMRDHLVEDGHSVRSWTRSQGTRDELRSTVEGADVVVTVLFGPDAVRETVLEGDLPLRAGALWVDVTTVSPADATAFAQWAGEHGVRYVHSPVVGSLEPARRRALGVFLGGEADAVAAARQVVTWGDPEKVREFATPAQASAAKLIANLALGVAMEGVVEALRLGGSNELQTGQVLDVLGLTMIAGLAAVKGPLVASGEFTDTQFSADLLAKDARLMKASTGAPLPALEAVLRRLEAASAAGRGDEDFAVVAALPE